MNPKALFGTVSLLATLLHLAPSVYGCVNFFAAQGISIDKPLATWLDGKLWDNPDSSGDPMCTLSSNPPYNFQCAAGYSASLDDNQNSVTYKTPHGDYTFGVQYVDCGGNEDPFYCSTYQGCSFGCSQGDPSCFAFGCTQNNYSGCGP